jgi:acetoin utilization protein AcuB
MKVEDVMTRDPSTIGPDVPVRTARELMRDKGIRHLPVVDATGRLLGMLTDRDLKHAAFMPALSDYLGWAASRLKAPRVRDLMTWSVVTTTPGATLAQAGLTIFERRIGCLPVVEDGRLVGILTERDILKALHKDQADIDPDEFPW